MPMESRWVLGRSLGDFGLLGVQPNDVSSQMTQSAKAESEAYLQRLEARLQRMRVRLGTCQYAPLIDRLWLQTAGGGSSELRQIESMVESALYAPIQEQAF